MSACFKASTPCSALSWAGLRPPRVALPPAASSIPYSPRSSGPCFRRRRWFTEVGDFVILKEHDGFEVRNAIGRRAVRTVAAAGMHRIPRPAPWTGVSQRARVCAATFSCMQRTHASTPAPTRTHAHTQSQVAATFVNDKPRSVEINKEFSWTQTVRVSTPEGEWSSAFRAGNWHRGRGTR